MLMPCGRASEGLLAHYVYGHRISANGDGLSGDICAGRDGGQGSRGPAVSEYVDGVAVGRGGDDAQDREWRSGRPWSGFDGCRDHRAEIEFGNWARTVPRAGERAT